MDKQIDLEAYVEDGAMGSVQGVDADLSGRFYEKVRALKEEPTPHWYGVYGMSSVDNKEHARQLPDRGASISSSSAQVFSVCNCSQSFINNIKHAYRNIYNSY